MATFGEEVEGRVRIESLFRVVIVIDLELNFRGETFLREIEDLRFRFVKGLSPSVNRNCHLSTEKT